MPIPFDPADPHAQLEDVDAQIARHERAIRELESRRSQLQRVLARQVARGGDTCRS
jgi:hypothetical protein